MNWRRQASLPSRSRPAARRRLRWRGPRPGAAPRGDATRWRVRRWLARLFGPACSLTYHAAVALLLLLAGAGTKVVRTRPAPMVEVSLQTDTTIEVEPPEPADVLPVELASLTIPPPPALPLEPPAAVPPETDLLPLTPNDILPVPATPPADTATPPADTATPPPADTATPAPAVGALPPTPVPAADSRPLAAAPVLLADSRPPAYPEAARRARQQGTVWVTLLVAADGTVAGIKALISSGYAPLDQAALHAVSLWRFAPARAAAQPVACELTVPVRFVLAGEVKRL